jgi:hypothetical protein
MMSHLNERAAFFGIQYDPLQRFISIHDPMHFVVFHLVVHLHISLSQSPQILRTPLVGFGSSGNSPVSPTVRSFSKNSGLIRRGRSTSYLPSFPKYPTASAVRLIRGTSWYAHS